MFRENHQRKDAIEARSLLWVCDKLRRCMNAKFARGVWLMEPKSAQLQRSACGGVRLTISTLISCARSTPRTTSEDGVKGKVYAAVDLVSQEGQTEIARIPTCTHFHDNTSWRHTSLTPPSSQRLFRQTIDPVTSVVFSC